jgi:hypothetical protein
MRCFLIRFLLVCAACVGFLFSCDILNIGNVKVDAYLLVFPDRDVVPGTYQDNIANNRASFGYYDVNVWPQPDAPYSLMGNTDRATAQRHAVYAQDRENGGNRGLFSISYPYSAPDATSDYWVNYLYVVPSAISESYLPVGMTKAALTEELQALCESSAAGSLDRATALELWEKLRTTGYPHCGCQNTCQLFYLKHSDIFGN